MSFDYNPEALTQVLVAAGFDALNYDYVEALKEEGTSNHQVYINPKGSVRYQFSKPISQENFSTSSNNQLFQVEKEIREITNLRGELKNTGDLEQILNQLPKLLGKDNK